MNNYNKSSIMFFASLFLSIANSSFSQKDDFNFLGQFQTDIPQISVQQIPVNELRWMPLQSNAVTPENIVILLRDYPNLTTLIIDGRITDSQHCLLEQYLSHITVLINEHNDFIPLDEYGT